MHRELFLAPGAHELEVRFFADAPIPIEEEPEADRASRPEAPGEAEGRARLALRESLELEAGEVALVTYDLDAGRLVLRRSGER